MENTFLLGDCYKLIKTIPDKTIDLIITDPPYDISTGGKSGSTEIAKRFQTRFVEELQNKKLDVGMDFELLKEFERVLKKIYIYMWCNKNLLFDLIEYYNKRNDVNLDIIVWAKLNPMPLCNNHFLNDVEYCLCIHEKGIGWNDKAGFWVKRKCYVTEVNKKDKELYNHPTIKPIEIIKNFILNSSKENDVIFDPFAGSGTTLVAAQQLNRKYIGFEIDYDYFKIACDRLDGITQKDRIKEKNGQMSIFDFMEE